MRITGIRIRSEPEHIRRSTDVIDGHTSSGELTGSGSGSGGGVRAEVGVALIVYFIERCVI
jgi:hypothetical protein